MELARGEGESARCWGVVNLTTGFFGGELELAAAVVSMLQHRGVAPPLIKGAPAQSTVGRVSEVTLGRWGRCRGAEMALRSGLEFASRHTCVSPERIGPAVPLLVGGGGRERREVETPKLKFL